MLDRLDAQGVDIGVITGVDRPDDETAPAIVAGADESPLAARMIERVRESPRVERTAIQRAFDGFRVRAA